MVELSKSVPGICALLIGFATPAASQENIDCGYPVTQMEMTYCAEKSWNEADEELNSVYKSAMARMKEMDSLLDPSLRGAADALRAAQRAWIPYRDKACEAYGFMARGGSMEPMLIYGCRATLTRTRIEELKDLEKGLGN